jgi:hypothetical protein
LKLFISHEGSLMRVIDVQVDEMKLQRPALPAGASTFVSYTAVIRSRSAHRSFPSNRVIEIRELTLGIKERCRSF